MVIRENAPSPVFSTLPASLADDLRRLPRCAGGRAGSLGNRPHDRGTGHARTGSDLPEKGMSSILDQPVICGPGHRGPHEPQQRGFPACPQGEGRRPVLDPGRRSASRTSSSAARSPAISPTPRDNPRQIGDSLRIGGKEFTIVGIYETGSMFLDVVIVMDIETARSCPESAQGLDLEHLRRGQTNPARLRRPCGRDREGQSGSRRPQHERGQGQLRLADGAG